MPFELTVRAESADQFRFEMAKLASLFVGSTPAPLPESNPEPEQPKASRAKKAEPVKTEQPKEQPTEPEKAPETSAVTMEELRSAMGDLIKTPSGSKAAVDLITELKAFDDEGMPKLANVKPEDFAKCLELIKAATAKASTGAGVL